MLKQFEEGMTQNERVQIWMENSKLLKELKAIEMQQRKQVDALLFPDPKNGTNTYELGNDWKLKSVHGIDTSLDKAAYQLIEAELSDEVKDKVIKIEPKLDVREYKKLAEEERKLLDEAVVTKPKSITMTIVPPKEDK